MKSVYPVIFTETENVILVEVPDFQILTEGKDMADAIAMARDAIGIVGISREDHGEAIPVPSQMSQIKISNGTFAKEGESFLSLVDIDFLVYRKQMDNKMVRRNVTLPNWLNREAEKAHINVSKVLREALISVLEIGR
ncbi:MAG: HicB family protein [Lachnospiraceae bacterium]|nr:HicB family protein [Lachnospiraceae bacterium]